MRRYELRLHDRRDARKAPLLIASRREARVSKVFDRRAAQSIQPRRIARRAITRERFVVGEVLIFLVGGHSSKRSKGPRVLRSKGGTVVVRLMRVLRL